MPKKGIEVRGRHNLLLSLYAVLGPISIDMYLPGLPRLADAFGVGSAQAEFTVSSFLVGFCAGQLFYGPVSDHLGRRKPLLAGLVVFTLASIGCALVTSFAAFVVLRCLQAFGGSAAMILARASVRDRHGREAAAGILSLMTVAMTAAPLIAPQIGGMLVAFVGWRAVFWLLAALGVAGLLGTATLFDESLPRARRVEGWSGSLARSYGVVLRSRRFLGYALSGALVVGGMFTYIAGSPAVFIAYYGLSSQQYALLFGINGAGIMLCALLNRRLVGRLGADRLLLIGTVCAAASGGLLVLTATTAWSGLAGIALPVFCFVASVGLVGANSVAASLDLFSARAGAAAGLVGTFQFGAGALLSGLLALAHDHSAPLPMSYVMWGASVAALGMLALTREGAVSPHRNAGTPQSEA